jgi:uncharacterized protein with PIN domain
MAVTDDPHAKPVHESEFRFYEELNDFLPPERRRQCFRHRYTDTPSVKDAVEALGVPHTEIDVILVDGRSVGFGHRLRGGERVAVYPVFERLDVSPLTRLRPRPLRVTRFIADIHLGTLARYLRLLGFDTVWRNDLTDEEIIERSLAEQRIILTRDVGILRNGRVTHGYWPRSTEPLSQLEEVVHALQLGNDFAPYSRCLECNGECVAISRPEAAGKVPLQVFLVYRDFRRCTGCGRVYWPGSHVERLDDVIRRARRAARGSPG